MTSPPAEPVETFEAMYRRELPAIIALGVAMTGSRDVGVDVAHEAMLRAYRDWSSVGAYDRPGAWVRRVAINQVMDMRRRRERERRGVSRLAALADVGATPAEPTNDEFWSAVRALPERQRAAVALHYLEDMSVADVAAVLEVSPGTIKASLFQARRTLAGRLGLAMEEDRS